MSRYTTARKNNKILWSRWYRMCQRCNNNELYYDDVKVCDDWNIDISGEQGFLNFLDDMGDDFDEQLTLDRIDPKGPYDAHNCRWVTPTVQNRNTRFHKYTERGKALTKMLEKWGHSKRTKQRFWQRTRRGWSYEDTINIEPNLSNRGIGKSTDKDIKLRRKRLKSKTIWQKIRSII